MKFGSALPWILSHILWAEPDLFKILISMVDMADAYMRVWICVGTKLGGRPRPLRELDPSLVPEPRTRITVT